MPRAAARFGLVSFVLAVGCTAPPPHAGRDRAEPERSVRILRDSWGVPHVFGETDADVAFGLAWAHAEDDFATIQTSLLAARGVLARRVGRRGAANDYLVALLRVHETVAERYALDLSPATRALVEAYAEGLNLYARHHPEETASDVLPFTGQDVVAGFVHKIPLFFRLDRVLRELLDGRPEAVRAAVPTDGSNAFAVAPSRSADGRTRLAVNSHQPWDGPVAWYEAHLHSEQGWDMVGSTFPGAPVILHGHNRHLGWASTVNRPDLVDVYRLETDPEHPDRYRFDGAWRELERRHVGIGVKLLGPLRWTVSRELLASVHGPVLRTPTGTYAVRHAGAGDVRHVEQWYRLNKARSLDEWRDAMRLAAMPMFNFVYADERGNILYVYNGLIPRRAEGYDWRGVVPGDTSETLWTGYWDWDRLPQVSNPPSGFLQNCNSDPFRSTVGAGNPRPEAYPESLGIERHMTNRALRAHELFGADTSITREEFLAYKYDLAYSPRSRVAGWVREILAAELPDEPAVRQARAVLRDWDLRTDPGNRGAAIAVGSLGPRVLAEALGEEPPDLRDSFIAEARRLTRAWGRIDVPWGQVNRLVRGELDLALGGGPDVLHAVYGRPERGRLVGWAGDSYVLVAEWGPEGVRSWSVHVYGSATSRPDSPHHADQAPLFAARQLKPVWLDEAEIRLHLEREYRPGTE